VFAYHNVGVRCLLTLLAHSVEIPLVVTHKDDPNENVWFDNVANAATDHNIPYITPDNPNDPDIVERIKLLQPDFIFSFYYRHMLRTPLLQLPSRGAFNMHGSLLPKYRGRSPVNWAVLKGETKTGATLHYMTPKPDDGDIVDQMAVPILSDDIAKNVFDKVTVAAEIVLHRSLAALLTGKNTPKPQDHSQSSYFGGRRPEDGRINWRDGAADIHNLVRAVAPPYPGAFTQFSGKNIRILRTILTNQSNLKYHQPTLYCEQGHCYALCGDGKVLRILQLELDGKVISGSDYNHLYGENALTLSA
jgi:methionyl-tRNA formyltransferase